MTRTLSRCQRKLLGITALTLAALGTPAAAAAAALSPSTLSAEASHLVSVVAADWSAHQLPDGQLVDPVLGTITGSYGTAMTGQAMVEVGASDGNETLIGDGLRAEVAETEHPDDGGFELLALSEAFSSDQAALANNPAWVSAWPALAAFLSDHAQTISGAGAGACYAAPSCYDNLKLVEAAAELALLNTGLSSSTPGALLQSPPALHKRVLRLLAQAAVNTGTDARRLGNAPFAGAGILSDPARNPLAYHALSTLMFGRVLQNLAGNAPRAAVTVFSRMARALVGLLAPDGNVAYIGRGQGQVWTVAATVDALSIAASRADNSVWRARFLTGVALELSRLRTVYPLDSWGFPLVPRLAGSEPAGEQNYLGIDGYANAVEYNGLALWALANAARALAKIPSTTTLPIPSTQNGVFIDPSHTQFAAVTAGRLWFAIHGTDSDSTDARYDFGLVAAELRTPEGWRSVLPYRPFTSTPTSGGPALLVDGRALRPVGQRMRASTNGKVIIHGGWATGENKTPTVDLGATWTYQPTSTGNGVVLSFHVRPGHTYQFQVWYQTGSQLSTSRTGLEVKEPDGTSQSYAFDVPVLSHSTATAYHSAYVEEMNSTVITVPAGKRAHVLTYTTTLGA